jgi:hypothetical protein
LIYNWKIWQKRYFQIFGLISKTVININENHQLVGGIDDVELEGVDEVVATNPRRRHVEADLVDDFVVVVLDQQVRPTPKGPENDPKSYRKPN